MECMFVLKTLSPTQRPTEGQNIFGDLLETTAFKSYAAKHERKSQLLIIPVYIPTVSFLRLTIDIKRGTLRDFQSIGWCIPITCGSLSGYLYVNKMSQRNL